MLSPSLSLTWALDFIKASSPSFRLGIHTHTHTNTHTHTHTHSTQQLFGRRAQTRHKGCSFKCWTSHDWAVMVDAEQRPAAEVTSVKNTPDGASWRHVWSWKGPLLMSLPLKLWVWIPNRTNNMQNIKAITLCPSKFRVSGAKKSFEIWKFVGA